MKRIVWILLMAALLVFGAVAVHGEGSHHIPVSGQMAELQNALHTAPVQNGQAAVHPAPGMTLTLRGIPEGMVSVEVLRIAEEETEALAWMEARAEAYGTPVHAYAILLTDASGNRQAPDGVTVTLSCSHCEGKRVAVGLRTDGATSLLPGKDGSFTADGSDYFLWVRPAVMTEDNPPSTPDTRPVGPDEGKDTGDKGLLYIALAVVCGVAMLAAAVLLLRKKRSRFRSARHRTGWRIGSIILFCLLGGLVVGLVILSLRSISSSDFPTETGQGTGTSGEGGIREPSSDPDTGRGESDLSAAETFPSPESEPVTEAVQTDPAETDPAEAPEDTVQNGETAEGDAVTSPETLPSEGDDTHPPEESVSPEETACTAPADTVPAETVAPEPVLPEPTPPETDPPEIDPSDPAGSETQPSAPEACPHEDVAVIPGYPAVQGFPGMTDGLECRQCGEVLAEQELIPSLGW